MKTTTNSRVAKTDVETPQAWIAIKRNRQKIYNTKGKTQVYLKDGQEFQLELFNPTQIRYLAKIKINGNYQSDRGLILHPGQRYFLDRFIDEDRKLTFSTYEVEDTETVRKAIERNGLVEVEFYAETFLHGSIITYPKTYPQPWSQPWSQPIWTTNPSTFWCGTTSNTGTINTLSGNSNLTYGGTTVNNVSYASSVGGTLTNTSNYSYVVNDASIETGRVERGRKSDQEFEDGYGTFSAWAAYTTTVQIIPLSQKPAESQEIRSYCTGCGSRIKKQTWKFCPNCGTEAN